jgi:hypothetical protein
MSAQAPAAYSRDRVISAGSKPLPPALRHVSLLLAVLGLALFVAGAAMGNDRAWHAFQVNWLFFTTVSSAAVMFVAVQRITTARWSRGIIRFSEGFVAFMPFALLGLILMVVVGKSHVYPWWKELPALPHEKQVYLGHQFFAIRTLGVFTLITVLQVWYVWTSVRLDVGITPEAGAKWAAGLRAKMRAGFGEERRELHSTHSLQGRIAVFMTLIFAFGWVVLAWDQSMSLDPHFYSTMYGWQVFMGGWIGSLMVLALLLRGYKKYLGAADLITDSHYHDVGKLCFAFTAFWGYLTFAQYLVIWYGNMPEETHFFTLRLTHVWKNWTLATAWMTFALPFFGLIGIKPKMWAPTMFFFAASGIIGLWIARYVEVYPSVYGITDSSMFGVWEIGITLGFLGVWGFCYTSFMDAFPKFRVLLLTSPYRDEVQVPVDPRTMEPLPAHE